MEKSMIREAGQRDLDAILELYLFLHQDSIPEKDEHLVCQDWWLCNYGECKQLHYVDMEDKPHPGYVDMIDELTTKFPLSEP